MGPGLFLALVFHRDRADISIGMLGRSIFLASFPSFEKQN
jgi:hypothetical protein